MALRLENITKSYRKDGVEIRAVDSVSLTVQPGEFTGVKGASGCGKTTLLLLAGGLLRPTSGAVSIGASKLYGMPFSGRARFRAENIGFVFQQFHLIPYLDIRDNILAASLAARQPGSAQHASELIERFNLGDRASHLPEELSTGERQRTALAQAMLNNPKVLLADEPTGNLDDVNGKTVLEALAGFARSGGGVLLVTHDPRATEYADTICRMDGGRIEREPVKRVEGR